MAIPWPSNLQELVNEDSFSYDFGETVIRSDMDVGPKKLRRRSTRPIDLLTVSVDLTTDQFTDFQIFFNTTTNGGVSRFEFNHPITGDLTEFRFSDVPRVSSIGGGHFRVIMQWEKMV